jgi:hypothetical protein
MHETGTCTCDGRFSASQTEHAAHDPVRLAFLSEQTSHQQPASSTFLSEQNSTSHQPPAISHQPNEQADDLEFWM